MKVKKNNKKDYFQWKCNTRGLIEEIIKNNSTLAILRIPLIALYEILRLVARRASELNDPELNALMCRLALYTIADPYHKDYNAKKANKIMEYRRKENEKA